MTKMNDLSYDIEQLYIDGFSPSRIAKILECPIGLVFDWLEENGFGVATPKPFDEWSPEAQGRLINDIVAFEPQEDFSPFNTTNS